MANDKGSPDSAKKALADYYSDMLGSLDGSPLPDKERSAENSVSDEPSSSKRPTASASATTSNPTAPPNLNAPLAGLSSKAKSTSAAGAHARTDTGSDKSVAKNSAAKKNDELKAMQFAEPEVAAKIPTLAPPTIKTAALKTETISEEAAAVQSVPTVQESYQTNTEVSAETATDSADVPVAEPALQQEIALPRDWLANGRPEWAQNRFECLLFSVAGLKLAVPLVSLGSIHRIENEFTPLVGRADWFLGLYRTGERNIRVVDTAKWVMPRQYNEQVIDNYDFVIRLGDTDWGVACDSVAQAIQLEPSQVKWRTERSKRAWLSGTVIEHMCALLDAEMLSFLLQQDANQRQS